MSTLQSSFMFEGFGRAWRRRMTGLHRSLTASLTAVFLVLAGHASAVPTVPPKLAKAAGPHAPTLHHIAARAFEISKRDGNDTKGVLDLRSMRITRGDGFDLVRIETIGRFSDAQIDVERGNFAVLIDIDDDRTYDYGLYVFTVRNRLRGVLAKVPSGRFIDRAAVKRLNARTITAEIQRNRIKSPGTYRFAVFGVSTDAPCTARKPCIDTIPNRFPLITLDHSAPVVRFTNTAVFSSLVSDTETFPVSFEVSGDEFGTLVSWTLEASQDGGPWTSVQAGHQLGERTIQFAGTEGSVYDDDPVLTYSPGWTVDTAGWSFLGSDHLSPVVASEADGLTVSGSFEGSQLCILGGDPTANGGARVTFDGTGPSDTFFQTPTNGPGKVSCGPALTSSPHTFVLTVTRDIVSIDGYYVLP
jgi:hypothetical protein